MNWKKKKDNPEAQAPEAAAAGKGPAAFWKKNWKLLVPAACVIVAGGAFLLWPKQAKPASVDASYTEAAPEYRNVSNTLSGTGTLNPANTYTVKSLVDGKVLTSTLGLMTVLCAAGEAGASGFQLREQSSEGLGNAFAGSTEFLAINPPVPVADPSDQVERLRPLLSRWRRTHHEVPAPTHWVDPLGVVTAI